MQQTEIYLSQLFTMRRTSCVIVGHHNLFDIFWCVAFCPKWHPPRTDECIWWTKSCTSTCLTTRCIFSLVTFVVQHVLRHNKRRTLLENTSFVIFRCTCGILLAIVDTEKFHRKLSHPSLQTYNELTVIDTAFGASSKFIPIVSTALPTYYNAISDQSCGVIRPTVGEKIKHYDAPVHDLIRRQCLPSVNFINWCLVRGIGRSSNVRRDCRFIFHRLWSRAPFTRDIGRGVLLHHCAEDSALHLTGQQCQRRIVKSYWLLAVV